jgi:hypothetical protein
VCDEPELETMEPSEAEIEDLRVHPASYGYVVNVTFRAKDREQLVDLVDFLSFMMPEPEPDDTGPCGG